MAEFKAFAPGIEVSGAAILAVIDGMGAFKEKAYKILRDHGLENVQPDGWYPQQAWLDSFKTIYELIGPVTLKMIGVHLAKSAKPLPGINTIEQAFESMDIMYHSTHRKDGKVMYDPKTGKMEKGIGQYYINKLGDRKMKFVCHNPYPDVFEQGGFESLARRYKPADSMRIEVVHDNEAECRRKGGDTCTYIVSW